MIWFEKRRAYKALSEAEKDYLMLIHKKNGEQYAVPVSVILLNSRADEAESLPHALMFSVLILNYDLSLWADAFPKYRLKNYPDKTAPKPKKSDSEKRDKQKRKKFLDSVTLIG